MINHREINTPSEGIIFSIAFAYETASTASGAPMRSQSEQKNDVSVDRQDR